MLKIGYSPKEQILDLSKFNDYLNVHTDMITSDLSHYCQSLHLQLKNVLETPKLTVSMTRVGPDTTMTVSCVYKRVEKKGGEKRKPVSPSEEERVEKKVKEDDEE